MSSDDGWCPKMMGGVLRWWVVSSDDGWCPQMTVDG